MAKFNTPGVYNHELTKLPQQITAVETSIPAFIGYTEKAIDHQQDDLRFYPKKIISLIEYEQYFGYPDLEKHSSPLPLSPKVMKDKIKFGIDEKERSKFLMHYSLQLYFANGGKTCWIVSVGGYKQTNETIVAEHLQIGLDKITNIPEVTLIVFPDSTNLATAKEYYDLHQLALEHCAQLKNRFILLDVYQEKNNLNNWELDIQQLRDSLNNPRESLRYGAAYFPKIYASVKVRTLNSESTNIIPTNLKFGIGRADRFIPQFLKKENFELAELLMPVSAAITGLYVQIDHRLGVWKSPSNVNITNASKTEHIISDFDQSTLNIDSITGKSINYIKTISGKGAAVVWGSRTLAGNDVEWRYIQINRFVNMVKQSIINSTHHFVSEFNEERTWKSITNLVENFLYQYWRLGALMGAKPEQAYFVKIGLGKTMNESDIINKKMNLIIGLAVTRPSEFIISKIDFNMEL